MVHETTKVGLQSVLKHFNSESQKSEWGSSVAKYKKTLIGVSN